MVFFLKEGLLRAPVLLKRFSDQSDPSDPSDPTKRGLPFAFPRLCSIFAAAK